MWQTLRDAEHASWPFLVVLLSPVITVPLIQVGLQDARVEPAGIGLPADQGYVPWLFACDHGACTYYYSVPWQVVLAFLLPSTLNLLPFLWLFALDPKVRAAGAVAGLCGLVRLAIPPLMLLSVISGGEYVVPPAGRGEAGEERPVQVERPSETTVGVKLVRGSNGDTYLWHEEPSMLPISDSIFGSFIPVALVWLGTLAVWGLFAFAAREPEMETAHSP